MFKKIFVNFFLGSAAVINLAGAMVLSHYDIRTRLFMFFFSVGLNSLNINWCNKHLWHKSNSDDNTVDDYNRSTAYGNLDNVESHKVGSTLKRGSDLHK